MPGQDKTGPNGLSYMWTDRIVGALDLKGELSPGAFQLSSVVIHNDSVVRRTGSLDITTPLAQWAFAVTFPFQPHAGEGGCDSRSLLVRIDATVKSGRIGIGCVTADLRTYVSPELERTAEDGDTVVDLIVELAEGAGPGSLVLRNTAGDGASSRVLVRGIRSYKIDRPRSPDLIQTEGSVVVNLARAAAAAARPAEAGGQSGDERVAAPDAAVRHQAPSRRFQVLLTHTSRGWDGTRCTREYLVQRYADPHRLRNLPRFEDLAPHRDQQLYSGGVTLLELSLEGSAADVIARRCIDSRFKIQHVSVVGRRLVLCFEDFLAVISDIERSVADVDLRPGSEWRIDDNWFGGLHTVFAVNDDVCIVSSAGADAVLWVDLSARRVIRRWRLPAQLYGVNYELSPDMSVADHYIHNDIQLGHLNCAYPDGRGGCFISTLIQGDIGHVDQAGNYSLLDRGYVGCHGVRLAHNGRDLYFADSCSGRLMRIEPGRRAGEVTRVDSKWLHDVEQVDVNLFWFCLGDKNEAALIDVTHDRELGRFAFGNRGADVQFASIVRPGQRREQRESAR
jgi:hypothetical protein